MGEGTEGADLPVFIDADDVGVVEGRHCADLATERGRATAQRLAIETWLKKGLPVTLGRGGGVLPGFAEMSHMSRRPP